MTQEVWNETQATYNILPERAIAISRRGAVKRTVQGAKAKYDTSIWRPLPLEPITHGAHTLLITFDGRSGLGDAEGNIFRIPAEHKDNFSGRRLKILEISAILYMLFCTKTFTEYLLPPLFALCPAAIWLSRHCT